ncbi:MAG: PAS domain S-box protein [Bacteroidetes bacterium]|nr:PAS domain S-box protein [Bacteroidota bacterium]
MKIATSYSIFAVITIILLIIAGIFVTKALDYQDKVVESEEHRFRSAMLAIELFQSSEDLTRMAQSYVSTGDTVYKNNYFEILDIRNGKKPRPIEYSMTYWHLAGTEKDTAVMPGEAVALQELMRQEGFTEKEFNLLHESQANSDHLVNMEKEAFAALEGFYKDVDGNYTVRRKPNRDYAINLLNSDAYSKEKAETMTPIQQFMDLLNQRTKDELDAYQSKLQQSIFWALVFIGLSIGAVLAKFRQMYNWIIHPIKRLHDQVAEITTGNYNARCEVYSQNEIGELCTNFNTMAAFIQKDITERKEIENQVKERVKELQAFYHLSGITEREGVTLENLFQEFINILPQSWQYPEICCARIIINKNEFRTGNFRESPWMQSAPVKIRGLAAGRIEVGYTEEKPNAYEGPFLKEERLLLNTIAERLGHITERKQLEAEIKRSGEQLREAQQIARMGTWELDLKNDVLTWSDSVYKLFEIDPAEFGSLYKSFLNVIHPDDREMVDAAYKESVIKKIPYEISHRLLMKDGRVKWVNEICRTEYDDKNSPVKSLGIVQDITERKKVDETLRKSSDTIQLLLNSTAEAIYGLDMNGLCTFNNAACLSILGYEYPEELLGKNMHDKIHSKHADGTPYDVYQCPIFKAFNKGERAHIANEVLWKKDGTSFYAEYWSYPVIRDNEVIGAVVTFLDISERKHAEHELQKVTKAHEVLIEELQNALNNVKTLQGLIPICANCKKIRDDQGYWNQVEGYLMEHTDAKFSHGLCPDCGKELYGDLYDNAMKKGEERKGL